MTVLKKMFIAYSFYPAEIPKLKTSLYFSRQDVSKYVSGDHENSILKLAPGQDFDTDTLC